MSNKLNLNQIPLLCQFDIIKFLPFSSLLHLSLVNKEWRQACLPRLSTRIRAFWKDTRDKEEFLQFIGTVQNWVTSLNFTWHSYNFPPCSDKILEVLYSFPTLKLEHLQLSTNPDNFSGDGCVELDNLLKLFPSLSSLDCSVLDLIDNPKFKVLQTSALQNLTILALPEYDLELSDAVSWFSNTPLLHKLSCVASTNTLLALMTTSLISKLMTWYIYKSIGEVQIPLIMALENATELRNLALTYDSFTYHHQHLHSLALNQKILELNIVDNDSTPSSEFLNFFTESPQLTSFSIKYNSFSDPMLKVLVNCCQSLSSICLYNTHVTSEGLRYLLQKSRYLQHIDISIGSIHEAGPHWTPEPHEFPCLPKLKTFKLTGPPLFLVSLTQRVIVESELSELSLSTLHSSSREDLIYLLEFLTREFQFGNPSFALLRLSIEFFPKTFHYIPNTNMVAERNSNRSGPRRLSDVYQKAPLSDVLLNHIQRKYPTLRLFKSVLNFSSDSLIRFKSSWPSLLVFNNVELI